MKMRTKSRRNGFALVVTVSMMVLLTIVVVATLSLSTVTLRSVDRDAAQAVARANARLALVLAVGKLQEAAGPDQRVTATAGFDSTGSANPQWTGVWNAEPGKKNDKPVWLVSGKSDPNPGGTFNDSNSALLASPPSSDASRKELRAEWVQVSGRKTDGRFAYWVGDEGVKARVDINRPDEKETDGLNLVRNLELSQSPLEPGLSSIGGEGKAIWAKFDPKAEGAPDKSLLASMGTLALAAGDSSGMKKHEIERHFLHDLTIGGFGLPVNVRDGGLKADLSTVFDRSQESKGYFKELFGATGSDVTKNGYTIQDFSVSDKNKFFLSPSLAATKAVGPNWGILWNYARQWQQVRSESQVPVIDVSPSADTPTRNPAFPPYDLFGTGENNQDRQHTSSGLTPILAKLQIGFSIRAVPAEDQKGKIQLLMKPVVGLWNPHNVTLQARSYEIDWGLYPYFRFGAGTTKGNANGQVWSMWLRDHWGLRDSAESTSTGVSHKYMVMITPQADFKPGEFRLFSVSGTPNLEKENQLKPGWNEGGVFVIDMIADPKTSNNIGTGVGGAGQIVKRPLKEVVWIGDFFLEDTQHPDTITRYGGRIKKDDPGTWFTLKSRGTNPVQYVNRSPGLWSGGLAYKDAKIPVPEQIKSGWDGHSTTTKPAPTVTSLINTPQDIGTWSFNIRQSAEIKEVGQGLRGWVDANPRALVTNPRWDGSGIDSSNKRSGWHFSSQYMGGAHGMPESALVGDRQGGNRGLISEHGQPPPEPQTGPDLGRYQGLGGPTDKASGGQPNVVLFDVPRSPLVSLGQFQHAQLARYSFEPGFVVGNSYANPRVPLDGVISNNFGGVTGLRIADISYEVNEKLWDDFYFSTMGLDYLGSSGGSLKSAYPLETSRLANPRMVFQPLLGDKDVDAILADAGAKAPRAISARMMTEGAFNVNSTSLTAWKAILSSMAASDLPVVDVKSGQLKGRWETKAGIRFNRFGHPATSSSYKKGDSVKTDGFWLGWREISADELDELAKAIVEEVKERGPFRSMAEFVNRDLKGTPEQQKKGALQAAIDRSINNSIPSGEGGVGEVSTQPVGAQYSAAISGENQAAGNPGYLQQGDILQSLGPILQVRSDYFRIRTYGDARDSKGRIIAKAWCEAFVQRTPEYVDNKNKPEANKRDGGTLSPANEKFGRRFRIVSFRWLSPSEI